jgi:hypothetical protein
VSTRLKKFFIRASMLLAKEKKTKKVTETENLSLYLVLLCIRLTYSDWDIFRAEINQRKKRFSRSLRCISLHSQTGCLVNSYVY